MLIQRIAVFCGSSSGTNEIYVKQAYQVGKYLAAQGIEVIYGGSNVGLMKAVADGAIENGGRVTGVLPGFLQERELAHTFITELVFVETMHERKFKMNELADAAIALPGGYGTMEEYFEMLTWRQLGLHCKPVGLLNINGFYDPLIQMAHKMSEEGFLKKENLDLFLYASTIEQLMEQFMHVCK